MVIEGKLAIGFLCVLLAVVYKIAGRFEGKLWLVRCLEEASVYDLT